jgi:hypothetical protein
MCATSTSRRSFVDSAEERSHGVSSECGAAAAGAAAEGQRLDAAVDRAAGRLLESGGRADRAGPSRRPVRQDSWVPGPGRLRLGDREEISLGLHAGEALTVIAALLAKATSTVSREVAGNGGRLGAGVAGPSARSRAGPPPEGAQAGESPAGCPGHRVAASVVVAAEDLGPVADRVRRRSHDVGEPRNLLPGPVRPGTR